MRRASETAFSPSSHHPTDVEPRWLASQCPDSHPRALAESIASLVERGSLRSGMRFPTVRLLAAALSVSPGTVAAAWALLRERRIIETRRRGGSFVLGPATEAAGRKASGRWFGLDMASGDPDPALQPPLQAAFVAALAAPNLHSAEIENVIRPLVPVLAAEWPFAAADWATVGGNSESILFALKAVCRTRKIVAVEEPTSVRLLNILSLLGIEAVPVRWDDRGPRPDALTLALERAPAAFIYQPRGHLPLGLSVGEERMEALATVLGNAPGLIVVEDDWQGPLNTSPQRSLGTWLAPRTVTVRGYCKAYGLDLRSSVIGGGEDIVAAIRHERSNGLGMTSRIQQGALLHLLRDPEAARQIARARKVYAARRAMLTDALRKHGLDVGEQEGLGIWVPVVNETKSVQALAERGIIANPGSQYFIQAPKNHHIRLATSCLPDKVGIVNALAEFIASVATMPMNFD